MGTTFVLVHNDDGCLPGAGDIPRQVVNSNMGHIDEERATPVQASLNIGDDSFAGTSLARGNPAIKGTFSFLSSTLKATPFRKR